MATEPLYQCRRCKQSFPRSMVYKSSDRYRCRACEAVYKNRAAPMKQLERTMAGISCRLKALRLNGECILCGEATAHHSLCVVPDMERSLAEVRGTFDRAEARQGKDDGRMAFPRWRPLPAKPIPVGSLVIPAGFRNLEDVESMVIAAVLRETDGHKSRAADILGISRTTLNYKTKGIA